MAWFPALVAFVLAACVGVLFGARVLVKRRQQKLDAARRMSVPLPRIPLRSQVITVQPDVSDADTQAACAAKTREFSAHVDELLALSMQDKATRELLVHQAPTRELRAHVDEEPDEFAKTSPAFYVRSPSPSGLQPRTRLERRAEDDTLKLEGEKAQAPVASTTAELLRMLGPSPTPDLGNIEVYYRLGLVYLAANQDENARRCFLTVEAISPGYRDAAMHLTQLPIYAPTSSGATPVHHAVTTSGYVTAQRGDGASAEREPSRGFRKGR